MLMRLWHLRCIVILLGMAAILGSVLVFLSGTKSGLTNLRLLQGQNSNNIDRFERFKQKMQLPIQHLQQDNGSCTIKTGNTNTSLGPMVSINRELIGKMLDQSQLSATQPWPVDIQSLFDEEAVRESGLPPFRARIPALVYHKGNFLAFSEARYNGIKDFGQITMVMRRGEVKGREIVWRKIKLLASLPAFRTNNPSPVVDKVHDAVILVFAAFPTELSFEDMMAFPSFPMSKLYVMKTYDLGETWTSLLDITPQTVLKMYPVPVLMVPGPGHSIQLQCGRIIVPCNYFIRDSSWEHLKGLCQNCSNFNRVIFSDDGGNTWTVGGRSNHKRDAKRIAIHPNEVMAVEVGENLVSLNSRTISFQQPRAVIYSFDGGVSLSETHLKDELIEPGWKMNGQGHAVPKAAGGCQGSVVGFPRPKGISVGHKTWVILLNPADRVERLKLSFRLSIDGCQKWSAPFSIHDEFSAYSDIAYFEAMDANGTMVPHIAVLYEGGLRNPYEYTRFRIFSLAEVLTGLKERTKR